MSLPWPGGPVSWHVILCTNKWQFDPQLGHVRKGTHPCFSLSFSYPLVKIKITVILMSPRHEVLGRPYSRPLDGSGRIPPSCMTVTKDDETDLFKTLPFGPRWPRPCVWWNVTVCFLSAPPRFPGVLAPLPALGSGGWSGSCVRWKVRMNQEVALQLTFIHYVV